MHYPTKGMINEQGNLNTEQKICKWQLQRVQIAKCPPNSNVSCMDIRVCQNHSYSNHRAWTSNNCKIHDSFHLMTWRVWKRKLVLLVHLSNSASLTSFTYQLLSYDDLQVHSVAFFLNEIKLSEEPLQLSLWNSLFFKSHIHSLFFKSPIFSPLPRAQSQLTMSSKPIDFTSTKFKSALHLWLYPPT